jgi:DNA-binding transcriptional ArsR family regulator
MVEYQTLPLDTVFHALSDATRRQMLRDLAKGDRSVGELAKPFNMSLAAASKHIRVLEGAGLIVRDVRGRTHMCGLNAAPLSSARDWLNHYERFWTDRLNVLEQLLRNDDAKKAKAKEQQAKKGKAK